MGKDLLIEIGTEELPVAFIAPAEEEMAASLRSALEEARLSFGEVQTFGTPRRLACLVKDVATTQTPLTEEVKGPPWSVAFAEDGTPTKAAAGFARSQDVPLENLVRRETPRGAYVYAIREEPGRATSELLTEIVPGIISGLSFPKSMRWGSQRFRFARPIRWLVCLFGETTIEFQLARVESSNCTYGHRQLTGSRPIPIDVPAHYEQVLEEKGWVLADRRKRRERIAQQIQDCAAQVEGQPLADSELLDEVSNLVEWPTPLLGRFSERYLELPREVLFTPMRKHQRYFPIVDQQNKPLPAFITVCNGAHFDEDMVRTGNERVLTARLEDARFYFEQDLRRPLPDRREDLKGVTFQEDLGTMYEKSQRLAGLVVALGQELGVPQPQVETARRAAELCKCDLTTQMVADFPSLQGVMGAYYAREAGEDEAVTQAIREHYEPRTSADKPPSSMPGTLLALADRLDTLVGCFGIGLIPTGSQDPYGLRRAALGVLHILIQKDLRLSLGKAVALATDQYRQRPLDPGKDLFEFLKGRIRTILADRGFPHDTVEAVLACRWDDVVDLLARARALELVRSDERFSTLLLSAGRVNNITKDSAGDEVDEAQLQEKAEKELWRQLSQTKKEVSGCLKAEDYKAALLAMTALKEPIDHFFDQVLVMAEDPKLRANRLSLLVEIRELFFSVADLSKMAKSD